MDKILHLTLKKKWFDMIASGEKKEEYREYKHYWITRFEEWITFDIVKFTNGYGSDRPSVSVQFKGMEVATGNPNWGAELGKEYFVIHLGDIINYPTKPSNP